MRRGLFISGALAAGAFPLRAAAQTDVDVSDLVDRIPGITGVVARTMGDGPAAVAIRPNEKFASASVIKLAIMATVYRAYDAGTAKPSDTVKTRASDLIGGSDVLAGSPAGKEWSLETLVKAMIRVSDNSASNTLITAFGMSTVNATMQAAGMTGSRLGRHFADVVPSWRISENIITPADTAGLLFAIERGAREGLATIAAPQSCRAMIDVLLGNDDATKIVRGLPPGTPCAHKTGEIDFVRNDAGIVDPFGDAPYVLVVLTRKLRNYAAGNGGIAAIAHRVDAALRRG
ncbi:MAG: class A beta-lactamase-related serine hydrolase, partial [Candidatus Eremiobacteraeota bacterium]|nr:class A beta-lactamase-related serine hydrolase [Candidatus Eremiobacteraeota bacterium]